MTQVDVAGVGLALNKQMLDRLQTLADEGLVTRRRFFDKFLGDNRRDLNEECGYPDEINAAMYRRAYDRVGIAKRVVHLWPEESWAVDPSLYESEDDTKTEFEEAWDLLLERLNLWYELCRADILSGIGRFGVILLGFKDVKDVDGYATPVPGVRDRPADEDTLPVPMLVNSLLFLRCFDESCVEVQMREPDPSSPRFGKPLFYTLRFTDDANLQAISITSLRVHWSRVIHLADNRMGSDVLGAPRLQPVWDRVLDVRKILGGAGEMFWKGGFPGLSLEVNPTLGEVQIDQETIKEQMHLYMNNLQRYLALTGMTAKTLNVAIEKPTEHYQVCLRDIATTLGVPMRLLQGTEEAKLASTQDGKTWNKRVQKRQEQVVTPTIVRPFVQRLIEAGALPTPAEGFKVWWPDLNALSEEETSKIALTKTQALQAYVLGGVEQVVPPQEFLTSIMGMDAEEAQAIMDAASDYQVELQKKQEEDAAIQAEAQAAAGVEPGAPQVPPPGQVE